jgi:SOS-response transcriptional repressor LexA
MRPKFDPDELPEKSRKIFFGLSKSHQKAIKDLVEIHGMDPCSLSETAKRIEKESDKIVENVLQDLKEEGSTCGHQAQKSD